MKNTKFGGIRTPEPIVTTFGVGDYVGNTTTHAKIQNDRPSRGVPANKRNITLAWFFSLVHTSNNVEATFDFVEATFDFVTINGYDVERVYSEISSF